MTARILIAIDGSRCSDRVVAEGLELAQVFDAAVTFLFVLEDPVVRVYGVSYGTQFQDQLRTMGEEALEAAAARARAGNVRFRTALVEDEAPVEAILEAEADHDLTVVGTHGHRGVRRMLLGSVADELIRRSDRSHLVVRCPPDET